MSVCIFRFKKSRTYGWNRCVWGGARLFPVREIRRRPGRYGPFGPYAPLSFFAFGIHHALLSNVWQMRMLDVRIVSSNLEEFVFPIAFLHFCLALFC